VMYKLLLNPHGSDKTLFKEKEQKLYLNLLNPHGSDKTLENLNIRECHNSS